MPPARLAYTVVMSTGEDDGYSAEIELVNPGPGCKGWRSQEYCIYPQELVLRLERRSVVERVQFLVHNTMIPSSTEIHLGDTADPNDDAPDVRKAMFMEVGRVEWCDNKENRFKGRQLQTVELAAGAAMKVNFVKFIIKKNHINRYNEYNQVSFVGINILGTPPGGTEHVTAPHMHDLAFVMYADPDMADVMLKMEARKALAKTAGRAEYLAKLRHALSGLEVAAADLGEKHARKKRSVDAKKYDEAAGLKKEIDGDRESTYKKFRVVELLEDDGHLAANDRETPLPPLSADNRRPPKTTSPTTSNRNRSRSNSKSPSRRSSVPEIAYDDNRDLSPVPRTFVQPPPISPPSPRKRQEPRSPRKSPRRPSSPPTRAGGARVEPEDASFSSKDRQELELPIEVFGKKRVLGMLNKSHPVKEAAVDDIKKEVLEYKPDDSDHKVGKFLKAATILLVRLLREKLWSIFTRGIDIHNLIFTEFIDKFKPPEGEVKKTSNKCYHELLIRAGDPIERIGDTAEDAIKVMLKNDVVRRTDNLQYKLTEPLKPQHKEVLKQAVCKAELVLYLIKDLGDFYSVGDIIHFGISAVKHPSPLVRQIGGRILLEMYKFDAKQVVRRVPEDTPATRKEFVGLKNFYEEVERHERKKRQERRRARESEEAGAGAAAASAEDQGRGDMKVEDA